MKIGGALKMSSVHPVHVSASFQLQYKALAENLRKIPKTKPSPEGRHRRGKLWLPFQIKGGDQCPGHNTSVKSFSVP